ncbi:hypothetical protein CFT12S02855_00845 [Campylobacter fetus subsp. testudinum]|uniref:hypothetical protein n=1 Tax=Campylobacter fetus TaxID=196 RepID=UPI0008189000|nr:hypothetical protein [Campylobacter fetus]OCR98761.1 hypothetical protein CFT12S02855_00845 [Campylobacter fetus subsp. testudinum]
MIENILKDEKFGALMKTHVHECLDYLLNKDIEFCILANLKYVSFNPELPKEISSSFKSPVILFCLGGYTLSSAILTNTSLSFEAGFGANDFASSVNVPTGAIVQITMDENPLLINFAVYKEDLNESRKQKSKQIFMSNPKNKGIFKK